MHSIFENLQLWQVELIVLLDVVAELVCCCDRLEFENIDSEAAEPSSLSLNWFISNSFEFFLLIVLFILAADWFEDSTLFEVDDDDDDERAEKILTLNIFARSSLHGDFWVDNNDDVSFVKGSDILLEDDLKLGETRDL